MSTEHKRRINMLVKVARGQRLSKRQKKQLEEYASRSQQYQVVVDNLSNPEWVRQELEIRRQRDLDHPSPREAMWTHICQEVHFEVSPRKRKFPYFWPVR